jgi:hypothetical protein
MRFSAHSRPKAAGITAIVPWRRDGHAGLMVRLPAHLDREALSLVVDAADMSFSVHTLSGRLADRLWKVGLRHESRDDESSVPDGRRWLRISLFELGTARQASEVRRVQPTSTA